MMKGRFSFIKIIKYILKKYDEIYMEWYGMVWNER